MGKSRVKFGLFLVGISVSAVIALVGMLLLSQFIVYFQEGADPASIFRGHTLVLPAADDARWLTPTHIRGAAPSTAEQEAILSAYWLAWESLARAYETKNLADFKTYWSGDAYTQVVAGVDLDHPQMLDHTSHALRLTFFSDDGSVVAFEDGSFTLIREIKGNIITVQASASIVMTSDQGFWRIRTLILKYE